MPLDTIPTTAPGATLTPSASTGFRVHSVFSPAGDQPQAIESLAQGLTDALRYQTLEGITGSGKTATIAWLIERANRPTLIIEPNKSLAAQLASELREMFPENRVEFFVSYYDYYQPEAYIARTDTFIEKDSSVNEQIDRLRHAATSSLLTRRDTIVVASVSCIYGLGNPNEYREHMLVFDLGESHSRRELLGRLIEMHYLRNDLSLERGNFRLKGDTLEICPAYSDQALRVSFFGDEIESLIVFNPTTRQTISTPTTYTLFAATHYATSAATLARATASIRAELANRLKELNDSNQLLEAQRLSQRVAHDLEMLEETGFCSGVENYSAHLDGRSPGEPPFTLLDYFPEDFLVVIDESHVAVPQIRGQLAGDRSRKQSLVDHGFRLPSAMDNRPLDFDEFIAATGPIIFVSATPGPYERSVSSNIVPQLIRPTGLLDPRIEVTPTKNQIDDLRVRLDRVVANHDRALITTITKKMAEDLTAYLTRAGYSARYLHSDIDTIERIEILRDLRLGEFDILVGINLLREGLDLPEVALVAILDADKEGFLRSSSALIQTIGRAARNENGLAVMYADRITDSMKTAIDVSVHRRAVQEAYNVTHNITPKSVHKEVTDILSRLARPVSSTRPSSSTVSSLSTEEIQEQIDQLRHRMSQAALDLKFEAAAALRDEIHDLTLLVSELAIPGTDTVGPTPASLPRVDSKSSSSTKKSPKSTTKPKSKN